MNADELKEKWWYWHSGRCVQFITMIDEIDEKIALNRRANGCEQCGQPKDMTLATLDDLAHEVPNSGELKIWMVQYREGIRLMRCPGKGLGICSFLFEHQTDMVAHDYAKLAGIPIICQDQWKELSGGE